MKILLLGATGQVGEEIAELFKNSDHEILPLLRGQCDLSRPDLVLATLLQFHVDLVINAAAYTAVDKAEEEKALAKQINAFSVEKLANYCQMNNIPLIHFSTDYVFDGSKSEGYIEDDPTNPLSIYGHSKLLGEYLIQSSLDKYLILRISWVFGKYGQNFVKTILRLAATRKELRIVADQWGCPTAARDIARVIYAMVQKINEGKFSDWGIYHYASQGPISWSEFAATFINLAKSKGYHLALNHLIEINTEDYPAKAKRPKNSVLITNKIERIFNIHRDSWNNYLPEVIEFMHQEQEKSHELSD
ncbi:MULTISPECIES: dTDP-4-dehydrorhamnose reductase [unclassified Legionella]|uniref:dTDP-4-dehydrorhamnose reductase n=1 Tax=unclassified Legionella TaxID=2622702 RepID=UPI001054CE4A|nr:MULTISPECIES: dTDP-4-dehydrorhamnose reductase [unclassified Legionella]MDI9817752.1 dTDP-4-dehydrorhamnose reductase [Legionella sp. PL877]